MQLCLNPMKLNMFDDLHQCKCSVNKNNPNVPIAKCKTKKLASKQHIQINLYLNMGNRLIR